MDAAATSIGGKIEDKPAFQKALETVKFPTVRPGFHFNTNHYPIQTFYLTEIGKDSQGRIVANLKGTIVKDLKDTYAAECPMR
jgi:branched-chain amino acid transport system substrate-binding protein